MVRLNGDDCLPGGLSLTKWLTSTFPGTLPNRCTAKAALAQGRVRRNGVTLTRAQLVAGSPDAELLTPGDDITVDLDSAEGGGGQLEELFGSNQARVVWKPAGVEACARRLGGHPAWIIPPGASGVLPLGLDGAPPVVTRTTWVAVVHGSPQTDQSLENLNRIHSNLGPLSLIKMHLEQCRDPVAVLTTRLAEVNAVVVGSRADKQCRLHKGMFLCCTAVVLAGVEVAHPAPSKFERLLDREAARHQKQCTADGQPREYSDGWAAFAGLQFLVSPAVMIPRRSTETLVRAVERLATERWSSSPVRILDLGTGSGCILLSLLQLIPSATGVGCDISPEALEVALRNAETLGMHQRCSFELCDLGELWQLEARATSSFDIVVSNPPYLDELSFMEVSMAQHEPRIALVSPQGQMGAYNAIAGALVESTTLMATGALIALEVCAGRASQVIEAFDRIATLVEVVSDKRGNDRVCVFKRM